MGIKRDLWALVKNLLCSLPMGLAAYLICSLGQWTGTGNEGTKALLLVSGIGVGALLYVWTSYQLKSESLLFLIRMVRRRKGSEATPLR